MAHMLKTTAFPCFYAGIFRRSNMYTAGNFLQDARIIREGGICFKEEQSHHEFDGNDQTASLAAGKARKRRYWLPPAFTSNIIRMCIYWAARLYGNSTPAMVMLDSTGSSGTGSFALRWKQDTRYKRLKQPIYR